MKDPLGVSPSKGNQGTTRGKEKFLLTSVGIEPTSITVDLIRSSWVRFPPRSKEMFCSIPTEVKRNFSLPRVVP